MEQSTFEFNQEIFYGEIGAWIGAPLIAFLASKFLTSNAAVSISAVLGSVIGGALFWISTRIYHHKQKSKFKPSRLANDILYFTPIAAFLGWTIYNPTVYSISHYLLNRGDKVIFSVVTSQLIAFILFLIGINLYRFWLHKFSKKRL